jgi:transcriptional regulator with XRE-family HTH domain
MDFGVNEDDPQLAVKKAFVRNLQRHLDKRGWTQAELARQITNKLPSGLSVHRSTVTTWTRLRSLPTPIHMKVLCELFGVEPEDLVPEQGMPISMAETKQLEMREMSDGTSWIRVNRRVPTAIAFAIQKLIYENNL